MNSQETKFDPNDLVASIEKTLSTPPCVAGLKLRSDREIAHSLKVNVSKVRTTMEMLEKKGYLLRKHGSGTFVRRIANNESVLKDITALHPSKLFKDYPFDFAEKGDFRNINTKLIFGLWGDLHFTSQASQQLYASIISHINALGHEVTFNSMLRSYRDPFPVEVISDKIRQSKSDGHIVIGNCAHDFIKARGRTDLATVFFAAGNQAIFEPTVMFDTAEAVERAFRLFVKQGYTRIAAIGLKSGKLYSKPEKYIYQKEIEHNRFDYFNFVEVPLPPSITTAMESARELLSSNELPQAVYVADDNVLPAMLEVFNSNHIRPGRDIAVITLSNKGMDLPEGYKWSRIEFDPAELAREVVKKLLAGVLEGDERSASVSLHGRFVAGDTHYLS